MKYIQRYSNLLINSLKKNERGPFMNVGLGCRRLDEGDSEVVMLEK